MENHQSQNIPPVPPDQACITLLAMAETFRTSQPPKYKMAIKCLMAGLKTPCSTEMSSMLNFEIGKMLWYYSKNTDLSRHYLTQAFNMMKDLGTAFEDARLKVVCLIAELYLSQRMYEQIKALLKNEAHISMKYPFFHGKILFYLAEVYLKLNDFENALQVVDCGIIYFRDLKEKVVECYFRLAKSLLLATQMTNQHELGISVTELVVLLLGYWDGK
uniref:MAU2 chromatid cohesion factor homolog n=1 Tax=Acrobeloides nanus TaxID=290746 RepID=A0A914CSG6_9BILA